MDIKACKKKKILVFAGTFEGRALAEEFCRRGWQKRADFCVATAYGAGALSNLAGLSVMEGRMDAEEMTRMLDNGDYGMVIDATHPYAREVTENIQTACRRTSCAYLRLLRQESLREASGMISVSSIEDAVDILNTHREKVLLTTGAKELSRYRGIEDMENRVVARVLPSSESIQSCLSAGISQKNIIAMQGPFSGEMNLATMRQYGCRWLVTKNTGKPGGFDDKMAVLAEDCKVIVIERPAEETGISLQQAIKEAEAFYEE